jgi:MFS family permease
VESVRDSVAAVSGADDGLGWNRKSAALALLSFAMLTVSLDQYIVVVALPEIGRELGYSAQTLHSVVSAYTVASSGFLLLGGRAADLLGRRRIVVPGLTFYGGASLAGGSRRSASIAWCRWANGTCGSWSETSWNTITPNGITKVLGTS